MTNKRKMFIAPFSFSGRISRMEYFITQLIIYVYSIAINALTYWIVLNPPNHAWLLWTLIILTILVSMWFSIAQNTKRCHDLGHSGWWQLIPFFFFWLFLADGSRNPNNYGASPKYTGNTQE